MLLHTLVQQFLTGSSKNFLPRRADSFKGNWQLLLLPSFQGSHTDRRMWSAHLGKPSRFWIGAKGSKWVKSRKSWSACYKIVLQQFLCVPVVFFSVVFFHHDRNTEHVYTDKATKLHHKSMPTMYLLCCLFLPGHQNAMWVICVVSSLTQKKYGLLCWTAATPSWTAHWSRDCFGARSWIDCWEFTWCVLFLNKMPTMMGLRKKTTTHTHTYTEKEMSFQGRLRISVTHPHLKYTRIPIALLFFLENDKLRSI